MAYQVLARKWRPQSFDQIRGQGHIARALTNAISSGRIAHAYLFTGIRGVGKTSAARVLAKALNCAGGPHPTPCNTCDSCREITAGKSADVLEIDGASNTGVDDVRRLREAVRYPAVRGPYRVYIIDEVHMLSTAAFNALLKTLEEPPEHVVFVFATTDAHKIPVTILSRCQQFDFKRLAPRELAQLLADVAKAEEVTIDKRGLAALAREADGSVRDGQSLLDQVISYAGTEIRYQDVRDVLGVVDRELLLRIARAVVVRDPRGVLEALAEAEQFGYDVRRFAHDLLAVFRDLAVLRAVRDGDDLVELMPEEVAEAQQFCGDAGWEELHALFDMLGRGVEHLRSASRPSVVLEMTLLKMAQLPPLLSLTEVLAAAEGSSVTVVRRPPRDPAPPAPRREAPPREIARTEPPSRSTAAPAETVVAEPAAEPDLAAEAASPSTPTPVAAPAPETPPAADRMLVEARLEEEEGPACGSAITPRTAPPEDFSLSPDPVPPTAVPTDKAVLWNELLAWTEGKSRSFWSVLSAHAELAGWDPVARVAEIAYDDPSQEFFFRGKAALVVDFLTARTGGPARVEFSCADKPGTPKGGEDDTDRTRSIKKEAFKHPLVRHAVEVFDADVEEVRVLK